MWCGKNLKMLERLVLLGYTPRTNPWCLHPQSIKPIFYRSSEIPRLQVDFELRCFQLLSIGAWLPSIALADNW